MEKPMILVVDDNEINRQILKELLYDDYNITECANGIEALDVVRKNVSNISLILLDIMMPELDGIGLMNILKNEGSAISVPVIFITAVDTDENAGLKMGAVDFITKPFDPAIVKLRVDTQIRLKNYKDQLESLIAYDIISSEQLWEKRLEIMLSVCEHRDTASISKTTALKTMTEILLNKLEHATETNFDYSEEDIQAIKRAAMTLDIGKIRIPEAILFKPGSLTEEEFALMKKHAEYGAAIVESFSDGTNDMYVYYCKEICRLHHERWDGTGYPDGLKAEEIPLSVRVVSLVHVYNALTSKRPYREAFSHEDALAVIKKERGKYFDPEIVDLFLEFHQEFDDARYV